MFYIPRFIAGTEYYGLEPVQTLQVALERAELFVGTSSGPF